MLYAEDSMEKTQNNRENVMKLLGKKKWMSFSG